MIASIFDCDGTLYGAQFGRAMLADARTHGYNQRVLAYYGVLLPRFLRRKFGLIDPEDFNRAVIANLGRLIIGWDGPKAMKAFERIVHEHLWPTRQPEALERLRSHQAREHDVILLSGVFMPCLELIGKELGVMNCVGTRLEVRNRVYTGKVVPPVVTGKDKLAVLRSFLNARGVQIDWQSSYAYADSLYDRGILETVGHPVAVHPDQGLKTLAEQNGWEILSA
jgi:HAD superfamily hydrolase (TIGR01490 family)